VIPQGIPYFGLLALPPLCVFAVQMLFNRLFRGKNPQALAVLSILGGGPLFFILLSWMSLGIDRNEVFHAYMLLFYAFGAYAYFHVFNMSETSRRIRLLFAVADGSAAKSPENIYDSSAMLEARLRRLQSLRQIRQVGDRWSLNGHLLLTITRILNVISRMVGKPWPQ
jgi:hypothetical protein